MLPASSPNERSDLGAVALIPEGGKNEIWDRLPHKAMPARHKNFASCYQCLRYPMFIAWRR